MYLENGPVQTHSRKGNMAILTVPYGFLQKVMSEDILYRNQ